MEQQTVAVVPYYFLVWYNDSSEQAEGFLAVVPYYFLVWYNHIQRQSPCHPL